MISMTPRKHIPLSLTLLTPAVAIFLTLAVGAGIFGLLGFSYHYRHWAGVLFSGECVEYRR